MVPLGNMVGEGVRKVGYRADEDRLGPAPEGTRALAGEEVEDQLGTVVVVHATVALPDHRAEEAVREPREGAAARVPYEGKVHAAPGKFSMHGKANPGRVPTPERMTRNGHAGGVRDDWREGGVVLSFWLPWRSHFPASSHRRIRMISSPVYNRSLLAAVVLLFAVACGTDPEAESVTVTPANPTVAVGGTQQLTATVKDADGMNITDPEVTWSSSAEATATVDDMGKVTGVAAGTADITATSGSASGKVTVTVTEE